MSSKPLTEQRRQLQVAKLRAFAIVYLAMAKTVTCNGSGSSHVKRSKSNVCARRLAAQALGIRDDKTAITYLSHPIVVDEIRKHYEAIMLKYNKTADDVLDGISKIAFGTEGKPEGSMTYGDRLRALSMLALHHKLINRASEGDEDTDNHIRVYIPDNGRNPPVNGVMVGVKFYDAPKNNDKNELEIIQNHKT
jgi:hypothetical protein